MSELLALLAKIVLIICAFMYLRQVMKSESTPNPATWFMWLIIFTMNTVSYWTVVSGNIAQWAITLTSAVGLGLIFSYALFKGKFGKVGGVEVASFLMAVGIGVFWKTTGNAVAANLLLQVIFLISFVPTVVGLRSGKLRERARPWDLTVLAYVLMVLAIVLDWKEGSALALVYPIINGIVGNGSVALTIRLVHTREEPASGRFA